MFLGGVFESPRESEIWTLLNGLSNCRIDKRYTNIMVTPTVTTCRITGFPDLPILKLFFTNRIYLKNLTEFITLTEFNLISYEGCD